MKNRIYQSSPKFMHLCTAKKQNINSAHLCTHLVENFALFLNLKIVFNKLVFLKLSILKKYTTCT